jgi:flagellar hook assembly protein FlgD
VTGPDDPDADLSLSIFNIQGQRVRRLDSFDFRNGRGAAVWDGRDQRGREVASGLYLCRLQAGVEQGTMSGRAIKMVLLR